MVKRVSRFETTDGKLFDDEVKAKVHELEIEIEEELASELTVSMATHRPEAIVAAIVSVNHAKKVRDIINKYLSRLPKKSLEEVYG